MRALASILVAYTAVAAAVAAGSRSRVAPRIPPRARPALRVLAVAAVIAAGALWPPADGEVLAGLCVLFALSALATAFVLVEPLAPRLVWLGAAIAPVVAGLLAVLALR
jgi:hypothetical protein